MFTSLVKWNQLNQFVFVLRFVLKSMLCFFVFNFFCVSCAVIVFSKFSPSLSHALKCLQTEALTEKKGGKTMKNTRFPRVSLLKDVANP